MYINTKTTHFCWYSTIDWTHSLRGKI